ncbi:MAG: hypothetical protein VZS44_11335, partial [Bacilli bacterium]|nr:hypothetical protein [Bacilli bacterium]
KTDKDLVKTLCMTTYMHGYSFVNKAQFLSGSTKEMTKEEREEYINRDVNKKINEIIEYFSNKPINTNDLYNIYKTFFTYAYEIMLELCDVLRSKVFLYESMLFSIAIKLSRDLGYEVVNVYDCFYMANEFADTFTKDIIKQAYIQTREIYYIYKEMKTREKNKELLEYLESIDKIQIIDNRKYVEIGGYYIDFYKNTIHSKLQL